MKCGTHWHLAALGGGCGAGTARGPWRGVGVGSCVPGLQEGETPGGGAGTPHREGRLANEPLSPGGVFPREERLPEMEQLMARRGRRGLCFGVQEGTPGPGGHARAHRAACLGPGAGPSERAGPLEWRLCHTLRTLLAQQPGPFWGLQRAVSGQRPPPPRLHSCSPSQGARSFPS